MSRDYAKISDTFWTGETGRALRGDPSAQVLAMYLITSRHGNMLGVFQCPTLYMAYETGMSMEAVLSALQKLSDLQFCEYDEKRELVWVREMARFQVGSALERRDKRVSFIAKEFARLPNCPIKTHFFERYQAAFHLPSSPEHPAPEENKPLPEVEKPLRSQEQEQEQEQKQNTTTVVVVGEFAAATAANVTPLPARSHCPHQAIIDLYHATLPELRRCRSATTERKGNLRLAWNNKPGPDLDKWRAYFDYVRDSDFLMGRKPGTMGRPPFEADFGWLIEPDNLVRVLEGKYHQERKYG